MSDLRVFVLMPSKRKDFAQAAYDLWTPLGYSMAIYQDDGTSAFTNGLTVIGKYTGVWNACNTLARAAVDAGADACLFIGDDMKPEPSMTAQEIALQYLQRFPTGCGVMQPCSDPQGVDASGKPAAARICGSAWFGKEWIRRAYGGKGPTDGRFWHFYGDESLYEVSKKLGLLWMRPDIGQYHLHWSFGHRPIQDYQQKNQTHWDADYKLFFESKALGFPEGELLP